jgi:hypothetical protein
MRRFGCLVVLLGMACGEAVAQQTNEEKAARCFQLAGVADRYLTRRGEGSGGPNMTIMGARIDCEKGRYDRGIRDLEQLLRDQRIPLPPPPG